MASRKRELRRGNSSENGRAGDRPRLCFVEASGQNAFFGELIAALRSAIERQGVATETAVDHFPAPSADLVYVFVPHEYVPLTLADAHPTEAQLRRTVVISSEQPGTEWFEQTVGLARSAGATLDINPLGLAELARRGVRARRLQLGFVPEWDTWGGDDDTPRPLDVVFLGGYVPRRGRAIADCARTLERRRTAIHLVESHVPHTSGSAQFLSGEAKWRRLASAKTLLNVHRDTNGYFEWQRVVEAIANGCVVVSEHSVGIAPLVPGEHFVGSSLKSLPFVLDAVLDDEDLLFRVRRSAYDFLRRELPLDTTIGTLVEAAENAARAPVPRPVTGSVRPLPKVVSPPPPEWVHQAERPQEARVTGMALKRLMLAQHRIEKRLARIEAGAGSGPTKLEVSEFGKRTEAQPRVGVVISLHNYEQVIEEALWSVALSNYPSLELVVVDDASSDRSAEVAAQTLEGFDWLPSKLVRLPQNEGLPAARNIGVRHSLAELIFMLDADNAVYPNAFERLVSALEEHSDAAFAYGILETFDTTGSVGLMSWLDWSPDRLARGNYIDAAALIRRSALERVGGYTTDERLYGWEDFALWCAFAESDLHGVFVPEFVARYRTSHSSMIAVTNIDTSEAWSALLERHAFLRRQAPVESG